MILLGITLITLCLLTPLIMITLWILRTLKLLKCNDLHTRKIVESSFLRQFQHRAVNLSPGLNTAGTSEHRCHFFKNTLRVLPQYWKLFAQRYFTASKTGRWEGGERTGINRLRWAAASRRVVLNVEKIRFRFHFTLWPRHAIPVLAFSADLTRTRRLLAKAERVACARCGKQFQSWKSVIRRPEVTSTFEKLRSRTTHQILTIKHSNESLKHDLLMAIVLSKTSFSKRCKLLLRALVTASDQ